MKIMHITVNDKIATYSQRDGSIVCGNSDYMIDFTFDAEWEKHRFKTARFLYSGHAVDVPFEGTTVAVPILHDTDLLSVGVFAGDLQTTTPASIPCIKSILCQAGLPPDPEPDVYNQIMALINSGGGTGSEGTGTDGTASALVSAHNVSAGAHNDIRLLIESLTTSKVSVADIINNLTTNADKKPLSAAQGVALKGLIDAKVSASDLSAEIEAQVGAALENIESGARGTGILKVSTSPTSYTTSTGGKNPIKRMSISTIKKEAGVDDVIIGDLICQSYYLYHIYYLDSTYAYMDTSQSIRGATGASGTSVTTDQVISALDKETWTFTLEDGTTVTKEVPLV